MELEWHTNVIEHLLRARFSTGFLMCAISAHPATPFGVLFPFTETLKMLRPHDCSEEEWYSAYRPAKCFCGGLGQPSLSTASSPSRLGLGVGRRTGDALAVRAHWCLPIGCEPSASPAPCLSGLSSPEPVGHSRSTTPPPMSFWNEWQTFPSEGTVDFLKGKPKSLARGGKPMSEREGIEGHSTVESPFHPSGLTLPSTRPLQATKPAEEPRPPPCP